MSEEQADILIEVGISFSDDRRLPDDFLDDLIYQMFPFIGQEVAGIKADLGPAKINEDHTKAIVTIKFPLPEGE